jgi:cell wall-associated NlpC family hydrolase
MGERSKRHSIASSVGTDNPKRSRRISLYHSTVYTGFRPMPCFHRDRRSSLFLVLALFFTGMMAGCTGSKSTTRTTVETGETLPSDEIESRLQRAASEWAGTPHKWGGESFDGVDCSGLVQSVYQTEFQAAVPRTTEEQATVGRSVSRSTLQPGDLVFFRIPSTSKKRHVGIYLSEDEFLHATSSDGVTVSSLDQSYWSERWWQARRILQPAERAPTESSDTSTVESEPSSVGW